MTERFDQLVTEAVRPELKEIDRAPTADLVRLMNDEDARVPAAVAAAASSIAAAVDAVAERLARGGRLVYVGAGTAGRLGILDAAECGPTFDTDRVVAVMAGGTQAFADAQEGAEDDADAGAHDLERLGVGPDDAVVAISASGRTPYVLGAAAHARARGAVVVGLACNEEAPLSSAVDIPIEVVVGPEFIAGSTRLKAATAQKLVLNMLSTIAMVKVGKTFGNLMVDVRATNEKLRARAVRIVAQAADAAPADAEAALAAADGDAKTAIVMLLSGLDARDARERLEACGRDLRRALT
ncbi:MAG: N-acetylmuramic acid 6-phosphate etherase [Actinobacteria bacterium]|nr:MAG: N-acetylmuramic acid 6-phosphate etherase [Actinomycetota bacterium]